jgi:hypothetical protein
MGWLSGGTNVSLAVFLFVTAQKSLAIPGLARNDLNENCQSPFDLV